MYYTQSDGKIHLGPVWDMDLTLGSPFGINGDPFDKPEGWKIRKYGWYSTLFSNESFVKAVNDAYYSGIREELLNGLDGFVNEKNSLGKDAYTNWLLFGKSNPDVTLDYGNTYDEYCDNMIGFYIDRITWIDEQMNNALTSFK